MQIHKQAFQVTPNEHDVHLVDKLEGGLKHPKNCILGCEISEPVDQSQSSRKRLDGTCENCKQNRSEPFSDQRSDNSKKRKALMVDQICYPLDFISMPIHGEAQKRRVDVDQEACSTKYSEGINSFHTTNQIDYDKLVTPFAYSVQHFGFGGGIPAENDVPRTNLDRGWSSMLDITKPYSVGRNPRSTSAPNMHCYAPSSESPLPISVCDQAHKPKSC